MSAELAIPAAGRAVSRTDNNPPSAIERSVEALAELNAFLAEHPAIQSEASALEAARLIKRGKAAHDEMETERDSRVRPLNEQVKAINGEYAGPKTVLQKVRDDLAKRATAYAHAEEQRRLREAAELRRQAEEAERIAREADAKEREARDDAAGGVVGVDLATATAEADTTFRDYGRAAREATRAERSAPVKLGTGFGRSLSMRTKETLVVTDHVAAVKAIGLTSKLEEAIQSGAREYRKEWDALPPGVTSQTERSL